MVMKKLMIMLALAFVASASFTTAEAGKKKDKKQKNQEPVVLVTSSDSLSYAAGQSVTEGLIPYLEQRMGMDTAYMADFIEGFKAAIAVGNDPREKARNLGYQIAEQVRGNMLANVKHDFTETPDSIIDQLLYRGFTDALANDSSVMTMAHATETFNAKREQNKAIMVAKQTEAGRQFLAENAMKEGVITTPSGLQYKVLVQGNGEVPQRTDKVKVHYEGRLIDGTVFDASAKHGSEPSSFRADQVIKGWTEALTMMPVGSKWELYIPQELAYGERQAGQIPPYSTLIFQVELVGIEK